MRFAFTLTEVLLAVVIVGVIAALVLPAIVTHYQEKGFEHIFEREKQSIESALDGLAVNENKTGFYDTMMYTTVEPETYADTSEKFMKKYLRVSKVCGDNDGACFGGKYYQYVDNDKKVYTPEYKGSCAILKSGASICMTPMIGGALNKSISVLLDVNGLKGPNVLNKDLRQFEITLKDKLSMNTSTDTVKDTNFLIGEPECNSCDCDSSLPGCEEEEYDACTPPPSSVPNYTPPSGCCNKWFENGATVADVYKDWCCNNDSSFISSHHPGSANPACKEESTTQNLSGVIRLECFAASTYNGVECHINSNSATGWYVKKAGTTGSRANSSGSCDASGGGQALGTYSCFLSEQFSITSSSGSKNFSCNTTTRVCNVSPEMEVCRSGTSECKTGGGAIGVDSVQTTSELVHDPSMW